MYKKTMKKGALFSSLKGHWSYVLWGFFNVWLIFSGL